MLKRNLCYNKIYTKAEFMLKVIFFFAKTEFMLKRKLW